MIFAFITECKEQVWQPNKKGQKSHIFLCNEHCRVFKSLASLSDKNNIVFVQRLVTSKLKEALLRIEELSNAEKEALLSIINETAYLEIHQGSVAKNA